MPNKKPRKVNPRNRPMTEADVKKAKHEATQSAMKHALYLVLYILIDKHDAPIEDVQQLARELNHLSKQVASGALSWSFIYKVLEEDYDLKLNLK